MSDARHNLGHRLGGIALTCMVALTWVSSVRAQVPPLHQSAILFKALAYDRNLESRASGTIDVLLVYDPSAPREAFEKTRSAFSAMSTKQLKGLSIRVHVHAYTSRESLSGVMGAKEIDTVYVCEGLSDKAVDVVTDVTRGSNIASMTGSRAHIKKGVALAVLLHKGKPRLVVNLKASKAEGLDLKSTLLRIAVVIR